MALQFFHDTPLGPELGDGSEITLTGAEAHHAATVRRVRVGEQVTVSDGLGVVIEAVATFVSPKEVGLRVFARKDVAPSTPRLVLVQALAKGGRDELAVQTATEFGVDEVIPWQSSRSISRWEGAKAEKSRLRWEAIVREASKQAHRAWIPRVHGVVDTPALVAMPEDTLMLLLDPTASESLSYVKLFDINRRGHKIALIVGPEGGFTESEIETLVAAGAERVRLGENVLRTSSAGPAALAVLNVRLSRW
ncbi:16S rRNA (uracil1498-N3)-methyltransferase [Microbacterium endophyticum]|uniref:Ribosomal RNA small subunit methyltransferase E n=1 Tax=Microbacterium endophyticum TaxID=1526412 RepID=A0A7W4V0E7_9MICO|nr:16S rRNA (uracil(1498)-N(3))-methyltransferase [Microbacterium endophyticum]MBB2974517.1 16S rRNA (uracil1498-N3)-methyltransferase [Microbacterium endophyticum]NIK36814.1 16S rRNA (uracil1498-N3)-methyltransferase [Microbacterium endophyticum]